MKPNDLRAITSRKATGGKDTWRTPPAVLDLVRKVGCGNIGLDPCTDAANPTDALDFVCPPADGLSVPWLGHGLVFVNPPYSSATRWIAKCADEMSHAPPNPDEDQIIALVPARVDTRWWHASAVTACAVCFWKGRIKFLRPDGEKAQSATFPSAVLYWGLSPVRFKFHFQSFGWVVTP
jgi:phage N-6-adenine-methyltransferase